MYDNNKYNSLLSDFEKELISFKMLRYNEIPDIDLYMDQTIIYLNKRLMILTKNDDSIITSSMINNYVKAGIIPSPISKKYSKKHIAYIICVCFFKQILSMNEIKVLFDYIKFNENEEKSYNFFCENIEFSFKNCCRLINTEKNETTINDPEDFILFYACKAIASKLYAEKSIILLQKTINEKKIEEIKREVEKIKID